MDDYTRYARSPMEKLRIRMPVGSAQESDRQVAESDKNNPNMQAMQ